MELYDVAIAGGGPAGAATAIVLARLGRRVLLADRAAPTTLRVGEGFPPASMSLLRDLGVSHSFDRQGHRRSFGNVSIWGAAEPEYSDFVYNPAGTGYQLDRARFDDMLLEAARASGVEVLRWSRMAVLHDATSDGRACDHEIALNGQSGSRSVKARWLVDAGGRSSSISRHLGVLRLRHDQLVAFSLRLTSDRAEDADSRTWVEAVAQGWWYSALLPGGSRLVVFLTDRDLAPMAQALNTAGLLAMLRETSSLWPMCERHGYWPFGVPQSASAATTQLQELTGHRWLAVGDAAQSFDPLSSQGISQALFGGLTAGRAIHAALEGDADAMRCHVELMQSIFNAYRANCRKVYESEQRWSTAKFWRRRHGSQTAPALATHAS